MAEAGTVQANIEEIIDEARADANYAQSATEVASVIALDAAKEIVAIESVGTFPAFDSIVPDDGIPNLNNYIIGGYNLLIVDSINAEFQEFLDTYYPQILADAASDWILNSIENGGTGLAVSVEDAIWNRGRDRLDEELNSVVTRSADQFSRMGYVIPPGALIDQIIQAQEAKTKKACELNRDISISQAELEQKNVQFAVDQATGLQKAVWAAAGNLIGVLIGAYQAANTRARDIKDAAKEQYMLSLDYYRLILAIEGFELQANSADLGLAFDESKLNTNTLEERAKRLTDAALATANNFSALAASALSGQNSMATLLSEE